MKKINSKRKRTVLKIWRQSENNPEKTGQEKRYPQLYNELRTLDHLSRGYPAWSALCVFNTRNRMLLCMRVSQVVTSVFPVPSRALYSRLLSAFSIEA